MAEVVALLGLAGLAWTVHANTHADASGVRPRKSAKAGKAGKKPVSQAQAEAEAAVNGWEASSKTLRTVALLAVVLVGGLAVFTSIFTPFKLFPKQPSIVETNRALLANALSRYTRVAPIDQAIKVRR